MGVVKNMVPAAAPVVVPVVAPAAHPVGEQLFDKDYFLSGSLPVNLHVIPMFHHDASVHDHLYAGGPGF